MIGKAPSGASPDEGDITERQMQDQEQPDDAPAKRPRGRPEVAPEQRLLAGSIRLTQAQWDKLAALGDGEWLRKQIDKAKL